MVLTKEILNWLQLNNYSETPPYSISHEWTFLSPVGSLFETVL